MSCHRYCTFISHDCIPTPGIPLDNFEEFSRSVLDELLSWDPSNATQMGWHKYNHEMMDPSCESYARQATRLREFIELFDNLDEASLTEDELLDKDLAIHLFRLRIFEIERLRIHEQMSIAEEEVGRSLFLLFARDHLPFEERLDAICSRLEKVPEFLNAYRDTLKSPYKAWIEVSLETGDRLPDFIESISMTSKAKLGETHPLVVRLRDAVHQALEALRPYEDWLRRDVLPTASEVSSICEGDLEEYMVLKGLGVSPDEAVRISEACLAAANRERKELAAQIVPSGDLGEAIGKMRADHPETFERVLKMYRDAIHEARDFVREKDLATIPDGEKLLVIETPHFMRHLAPFAAQYEPGKFTTDRTGLFLVTPDNGNPGLLEEHSRASIYNTAVHEGYPGHHLQGIVANMTTSYVRPLCMAPCFSEGWALYCEDLMYDLGFHRTPMGRLAQLNDLVFRIVRIVADVELARKRLTTGDAAAMLTRETGMESKAAVYEAIGYTYGPTYYMSYFLGKLQLLKLREEVEEALGDGFSLRDFHDSLLRAGCLPMHFMRRVEAMRLKRDHGVVLRPRAESLVDFAFRMAETGRI
jgi:uncharacterized protein (DUF885 family)